MEREGGLSETEHCLATNKLASEGGTVNEGLELKPSRVIALSYGKQKKKNKMQVSERIQI